MFNRHRFCTGQFNLTFSFHELPENDNFVIDKFTNRLVGTAKFLVINDFFLVRKRENPDDSLYRRCKFLISNRFGNKLANDSYDGSIGAIITGQADVSLRPSDYFVTPDLIDYTAPFRPSSYLSVQFLEDRKSEVNRQTLHDLFAIFAPSLSFFVVWFATFCAAYLLTVHFYRLTYRSACKSQCFLDSLFGLFTARVQPGAFGLLYIAFIFYTFFVFDILQNTVKSNQLYVDTSQLITSEASLRRTHKELCLLEEGKESDYFKFSPEHTLSSFVYRNLMNQTSACFIINADRKLNKISDFSRFFTLILKDIVKIKIKLIENFFNRDSFVNRKPFFEIVRTFYVRKTMPKNEKIFLNDCVYVLMEQGWIYFLFEEAEKFNAKADNGIHKTFYKLADYVEENSPISDLSLENLEALFALYFAVNVGLLFVRFCCPNRKLFNKISFWR